MRHVWVTVMIMAAGLTMAAAPANRTPAQILAAAPLEQRIADLERRVQEKSNLERRDLYAQESMAASADEMVRWTIAQILLGVAGTAGLFATIFYTRQSLKLSRSALQQTEESLELSRTVYMADLSPQLDMVASGFDQETGMFRIKIKNTGNTPALKIRWRAVILAIPRGDHEVDLPRMKPHNFWVPARPIPKEGTATCFLDAGYDMEQDELQAISISKLRANILFELEFEDRFEGKHSLIVAETRHGQGWNNRSQNPRLYRRGGQR